ncbi:MAG: amino acid ABC transporter substrate-binding protein [Gammaproteobacteria bacterium]|nr:amino acid ABC transporter substrate-binding protein [Gammaproteobacteria bacterium]
MTNKCQACRRCTRLLLAALALSFATFAHAGDILNGIKARGELRCGVSEGIAGFSVQDKNGRWTGLDADFCRAVAVAVLGDAEKVEFVPLKSSKRFPALQAGRIDLLVRNTTWTLAREGSFNVQFPAILYFDGQGFMVPTAAKIAKLADLQGATVCVEKGTTHIDNLVEYSDMHGLSVTPLIIDSADEVVAAFFAGRCQAYTSDAAQLAAMRLRAPKAAGGPDAFKILPERISKEPLAPVVSGGDQQWITLVRWVMFTLVLAEEHGITRDNVATQWPEIKQRKIKAWKLAGGNEINYGQLMGATEDWGPRVIAAVGNYGEMYERNVGRDSPLKIERGLNRLWNQGGLMYAPPVD